MKTFVCHYHLNNQTTFLHHQNQVCSAHARILAMGYKNAFFRASHAQARDLSTSCKNSKSLKTANEFMITDMSKCATQWQQSPLILENRKSLFLSDQHHLTT